MTRTQTIALLVAVSASLLSACSPMRAEGGMGAQAVQFDGTTYRVEQITASTWTALAPPSVSDRPQKTAALVKAIEKASSCKVTDSSYGAHSAALTAQVDCGSRLKN